MGKERTPAAARHPRERDQHYWRHNNGPSRRLRKNRTSVYEAGTESLVVIQT